VISLKVAYSSKEMKKHSILPWFWIRIPNAHPDPNPGDSNQDGSGSKTLVKQMAILESAFL
jgi:hypothetical protein